MRERLGSADIVLFGTPDREIVHAYRAARRSLSAAATVVHFSGALASDVFARRAGRLALHPVMTFPGNRGRYPLFPRGCWFTLEGDRTGRAKGRRLVRDMRGKAIVIRADEKPLFHAACVFASNFTDVVIDAALGICRELGLAPGAAYRVLEPLVMQTLGNVRMHGTLQALSGPAERGDFGTIHRHLRSLAARKPGLVVLYRALTQRALQMARAKHRVTRA